MKKGHALLASNCYFLILLFISIFVAIGKAQNSTIDISTISTAQTSSSYDNEDDGGIDSGTWIGLGIGLGMMILAGVGMVIGLLIYVVLKKYLKKKKLSRQRYRNKLDDGRDEVTVQVGGDYNSDFL